MSNQQKIYLGKAKDVTVNTQNGAFTFISGSICLDDVPAITPHKNGKRYLNFNVTKLRNPDQYGNHYSVVFNDYKPKSQGNQQPAAAQSTPAYPEDDVNPEDIPF